MSGKSIEAAGRKQFFHNERGTMAKPEEATQVSLVPDGRISLKKCNAKIKTAKTPRPKPKTSNLDRDTSDDKQ